MTVARKIHFAGEFQRKIINGGRPLFIPEAILWLILKQLELVYGYNLQDPLVLW